MDLRMHPKGSVARAEYREALRVDGRLFRPAPLVNLLSRLRRPWLDRALALGADPAGSPYLARRAAILTSAESRIRLAESLQRSRSAARRPVPAPGSWIPPHRDEVAVATPQLVELEAILQSGQPVYCRGMALAWRLITDGASPLYAPTRRGELKEALATAIAALGGSR